MPLVTWLAYLGWAFGSVRGNETEMTENLTAIENKPISFSKRTSISRIRYEIDRDSPKCKGRWGEGSELWSPRPLLTQLRLQRNVLSEVEGGRVGLLVQ